MKPRFLFVIGLLLIAAPLRAQEAMPKPATVPFELLKTKHMAVMVKINGKGPYRVIFDTGAPVTVLSSKIAQDSGVLPKDMKQPAFSLFGAMGKHPIKTLEMGELKAEKVPAMVMDHPAVTALGKVDGPLEGIVGFPFFARYRLTLDYKAKQMTLTPSGYEPEDLLDTLMKTLGSGKKLPPTILAPAAVWGFEVRKDTDDEEDGVTVRKVHDGGAAAAAGLKEGDRLLTLDGRWTDSVRDCYQAAAAVKPGRAVPAVVRRDGKEKKLSITPRPGL